MLIGPHASEQELEATRSEIEAEPRQWIVQELVQLSTLPAFADDRLESRHLDLRPFVLTGETTEVFPGGLTRVAMRRGRGGDLQAGRRPGGPIRERVERAVDSTHRGTGRKSAPTGRPTAITTR